MYNNQLWASQVWNILASASSRREPNSPGLGQPAGATGAIQQAKPAANNGLG